MSVAALAEAGAIHSTNAGAELAFVASRCLHFRKLLRDSFELLQNPDTDSPLASKRSITARHSASVRRTRPSANTRIDPPPT
jgi:hypothetical protein